jgi:FkbM family methyltransferase
MNLTDSVAFASRKIAQTKLHKVSEALRRYYPRKSGSTMIGNFDGDLRMNVDRASFVSSAIYWRGYHSPEAANLLRHHLRPNMTFVDVGANLGEITLLAAKRLTEGRVLAFEPMPRAFAELSRNVALNNLTGVELFNIGLFDKTASLPMYQKKDIIFGTINEGVPSLFPAGDDPQNVMVPLRRFDDVAHECGLARLDVMKIDVEGAELMVLRGAECFIKRFRPLIIVELCDVNLQKAGYTVEELVNYFGSLQYDVQTLDDCGVRPLLCDAVCFPRESPHWKACLQGTIRLQTVKAVRGLRQHPANDERD